MRPINIRQIDIDHILIEYEQIINEDINLHVSRIAEKLREDNIRGLISVIPTYCSVLIEYNPLIITYEEMKRYIKDAVAKLADNTNTLRVRTIIVPVLYGGNQGPDLAEVARINGLSEKEVISIHTGNTYRVYMIGFNPGYPYLGGLDSRISTPRLDEPRIKVKAGSVAIGGEQTGIYSTDSPGGWRLIGHTPIVLFDSKSEDPVLLKAGDNVKFKSVDEKTYLKIKKLIENNQYNIEVVQES